MGLASPVHFQLFKRNKSITTNTLEHPCQSPSPAIGWVVVNRHGDQQWTLFSPVEVPDLHEKYGKAFEKAYVDYENIAELGGICLFKKVDAKTLWRKMLTQVFETGHPWITFKDPGNIRSPQKHAGVVHSSNLCAEITLNTSQSEIAVCNLGSVVVSNHIVNIDGQWQIDHKKLSTTVTLALRMLDNVIDLNLYNRREAKISNMRHRPAAMGMMGMQDAFYIMELAFDSLEAIDFSNEFTEAQCYYAYTASAALAQERGAYSGFDGSDWSKGVLPLDTLAQLESERGLCIETTPGCTNRGCPGVTCARKSRKVCAIQTALPLPRQPP